jgi:hypothetical protein
MKRLLSAFVVLTLCAVGCGDDSGDDGNKGGSSNAGTDSGQAGEPGAAGGAPASNNVACDPEAATTCQNETDCPFVQDGTARAAAQACGRACLGEAQSCAVDCILGEIEMSSPCAGCYADIVACTAMSECLSPCLNDPEGQECADCQVETGCRGTFNECSGLTE